MTINFKKTFLIKSVSLILNRIHSQITNRKDYKKIKRSNLFDNDYYLRNNNDVLLSGIDPVWHYLLYGGFEGRNPSFKFNSQRYLEIYDDVKDNGMNPLLHYLKFGIFENRDIFDEAGKKIKYNKFKGGSRFTDISKLPEWIYIRGFNETTVSLKSHFNELHEIFNENEIFTSILPMKGTELKRYTDILIYSFIKANIKQGARILEIGGGHSRVLAALSSDYECWNLDKFEGIGNGPVELPLNCGFKIVEDYIGNFNQELKNGYFDFVFSNSVFEHIPEDVDIYSNIIEDISRLLSIEGITLHTIDCLLKSDNKIKMPPIIDFIKNTVKGCLPILNIIELYSKDKLFVMEKESYDLYWKSICNLPYEEFGKPFSVNLLWKK